MCVLPETGCPFHGVDPWVLVSRPGEVAPVSGVRLEPPSSWSENLSFGFWMSQDESCHLP
jgi:hypothetical protein